MNAINCTLVPVYSDDYDTDILLKMRIFGIVTPDTDKVIYKGHNYYCVPSESYFNLDSLSALDFEEKISSTTKKSIKCQYMKICIFAFMFKIGNACIRDKYNNLIPIDLAPQEQNFIIQNNGLYSPRLVTEVTNKVYDYLAKLVDYEIIDSENESIFINRYQDQLYEDGLEIEYPDVGICCCCGDHCNPQSQTCGRCPRDGQLLAWSMQPSILQNILNSDISSNEIGTSEDVIDFQSNDVSDTSSATSSEVIDSPIDSTIVDIHYYNGEEMCLLKDVIKCHKDQFKGCLNPKIAINKKNISSYCIVSRYKKNWIPCADINERKAKILVPMSWVNANITR